MQDGKFVKVEGSDFELDADLVLLAMGFVGPEQPGLLTDLGVKLTDRGNVARGADFDTSVPGVFVAGDMGRGQSLIVWAIAEGRAAAAGVDRYLMGSTALPAPDQADGRTACIITSVTLQKHRYIFRRFCRGLPDGCCVIGRCGLHHRGSPRKLTYRRSDHCAYTPRTPITNGANRLVMVSSPSEEPRISR